MTEQTPEMIAAQAELEEATRRAAEIGQQQAGLDLERVVGTADAAQVRAGMEDMQRRVERATRDVERAADRVKRELDRQMKAMRADLQARMQTVNAALEPVKKRLEFMQEGIETLGLYVSAAEGVVVIRDGDRADALEPIVIRQMVLAMDEETGLFAEENGLTADDIDAFDEWLLADPAHVQQVIPERKGVVALVARWRERDSGDPWSHDERDRVTHFLVRNGDALFRTSVNDFHAGEVLLPRADEFVQFFTRREYNSTTHKYEQVPLTPGTRRYAEAMEASDKRGRHFLRIGLILQGLVDNGDVFAPLHPAGVNMLTDPSKRSEKVQIITDAEGGLESGEATFMEWQRELNAHLRPGMRIIGAFNGAPWRDANEWADNSRRQGHSRCHPASWNWESPPSGVPLLIEDRRPDGGLVVRYERTNEIYDRSITTPIPDMPGYVYRGAHRKPKTRASAMLYPTDTFILPFDLIDSSAQLRAFLASRRNRRNYRELWPLIRAAMFAKRAEEQAEAPFRTMLIGVLARENNVAVTDAEADVDDLIRWFKLKNRWVRPLTLETMTSLEASELVDAPSVENERTASGRLTMAAIEARRARAALTPDADYDEAAYEQALATEASERLRGREHEALAVRQIVAEHGRRLADRRRPINHKLVERLRAAHPDAALVARPRRGGYLVLLAAHPTDNVWVHELDYTARGELRERRDWRLVSADRVSRWTLCFEHPRWAHWNLHASDRDHLRGPEIDELVERLLAGERERGTRPLMISYRPATGQRAARFTVWTMTVESGDGDEGPTYVARDHAWRRENGELKLRRAGSWYENDEHRWELGGSVDVPWEASEYARKHVHRIVWGPDQEASKRWTELRAAHVRRQERKRELDAHARKLARSVVEQWKAAETVKLHAEFLAEVPDADWDEWERHLADHKSDWTWNDSHHHPYGDLGAMLRFLVGEGVDPSGMTAQAALDRARELGLPDTWKGFRSNVNRYPDTFPEAWADLVIGAEPVELPQAPAEPEPEDPRAGEGMTIADGVQVLGPEEPDNRDEFDQLRDALRDAL